MTAYFEAVARDRDGYLRAAQNELAVCPHCQMWLISDCINGNGCPTPDGMNGQKLRAELEQSK